MATTESRIQAIKGHLMKQNASPRPIVTYVNGDVCWLISIPRPASEKESTGKVYYHALVDPWFGGVARFLSPLVLDMHLGRDPGISSRAALDAVIGEIERAAGNSPTPTDANPTVDAIFIIGLAADHCHKESLLQFSPSTPLFAVTASAKQIIPWKHFSTVVTVPSFDPSAKSWKDAHLGSPLPPWLTVFPPTVSLANANNFGFAIITSADPSRNEMILLAPHGLDASEPSVKALCAPATPAVQMLALLAPLKNSYFFGSKTVYDVTQALTITQAAGTPYYVRSGDFVSLKFGGAIGYFVKDVPRDLQWGIDELSKAGQEVKVPNVVEVANGGSFVLV